MARKKLPADLRKPFALPRDDGESDTAYKWRLFEEQPEAVREGTRMLCDWLGVDPNEPRANEKLLFAMARQFIPYFRDIEHQTIGRKVSDDVELGVFLTRKYVARGMSVRSAARTAAEKMRKAGRKVNARTLSNVYHEWHADC